MPVIERLAVEVAAEIAPLRDAFAEAEKLAAQTAGDLAGALAGEGDDGIFSRLAEGVESVARTIRGSLVAALSGAEVEWDQVISRMALRLSDLVVDKTLDGALSALTGTGAGGGGGLDLGGLLGDLFGGFRAAGGPVGAGRAYVVGERGPELFVPDGGGSILPELGAVATAQMPQVTINITTPDVEGFRRSQGQVTAAMARALASARRYS